MLSEWQQRWVDAVGANEPNRAAMKAMVDEAVWKADMDYAMALAKSRERICELIKLENESRIDLMAVVEECFFFEH